MRIAETFLPELEQEMATTRRVLERAPSDKAQWKPHAKSFALGHLAQLLAWMPGWITTTLAQDELDLSGGAGYSFENTETLLKLFDENVAGANAALAGASDADMQAGWSLKNAGQTIFTLPRVVVVRQHVNHLVHHRGQMSVYLRLLDVPVPSIYGPTADERW
jgi:uncharacterized damage-inducible protein DinB